MLHEFMRTQFVIIVPRQNGGEEALLMQGIW